VIAQDTTRVSLTSGGAEGNGVSGNAWVSADGRCVAFTSDASNLVSGDTNGRWDIFVHDRVTGVTERISVDSSGAEANDDSTWASISADGNLVAFSSWASNLVSGDTNNLADVFLRDRSSGITECVSVDLGGLPGNSMSFFNSISADGRFVAFDSRSSNLVPGDTKGYQDVFLRDRLNGTTERVSVDSSGNQVNGNSFRPAVSADAAFVAFTSSAPDLVAGDTNNCIDVFVRDQSTGVIDLESVDSSGNQGNGDSHPTTISADGQVVGFMSLASNLDPSDGNLFSDIYVHDRHAGTTECVSVNASGVAGNDDSFFPVTVSEGGRFAAFSSNASDLVVGDTNVQCDVFVRDRTAAAMERVSVDSSGAEANKESSGGSLTPNGEIVAFDSFASNLVPNDTNGVNDAFVRDRCDAIWSNYGSGVAGTLGVPNFTAQSDPVIGSTFALDLDNSYGIATYGLLFVGLGRAEIPTTWRGDLLVAPLLTFGLSLPAGVNTLAGQIPNDPSLCQLTVDLQVFEADPGAVKGVSFTQGLELIFGTY
jgi:hypothetical protein